MDAIPFPHLSPTEHAAVLERAAQILADRVAELMGGLPEAIVLDLTTVARITGLSRPTIAKRMGVVADGAKQGVTLGAFLAYRKALRPIPPGGR